MTVWNNDRLLTDPLRLSPTRRNGATNIFRSFFVSCSIRTQIYNLGRRAGLCQFVASLRRHVVMLRLPLRLFEYLRVRSVLLAVKML